ncbi:MAG: hypothetical protein ACOX0J_06910 [Thermoactinomyces vulgaris]
MENTDKTQKRFFALLQCEDKAFYTVAIGISMVLGGLKEKMTFFYHALQPNDSLVKIEKY